MHLFSATGFPSFLLAGWRFLFVCLLCTGCLGEKNCPPFSSSGEAWFPYTEGQELLFSDGSDTLVLRVQKAMSSPAYSLPDNCFCNCQSKSEFDACSDDSIQIRIRGSVELWSKELSLWLNMESDVYQPYNHLEMCYIYANLREGCWNENIDTLNSVQGYALGLKWEVDSANYPNPVWRIYLARGGGILQFSDKRGNKEWKRIPH